MFKDPYLDLLTVAAVQAAPEVVTALVEHGAHVE
jgi:hypothetical protein